MDTNVLKDALARMGQYQVERAVGGYREFLERVRSASEEEQSLLYETLLQPHPVIEVPTRPADVSVLESIVVSEIAGVTHLYASLSVVGRILDRVMSVVRLMIEDDELDRKAAARVLRRLIEELYLQLEGGLPLETESSE